MDVYIWQIQNQNATNGVDNRDYKQPRLLPRKSALSYFGGRFVRER